MVNRPNDINVCLEKFDGKQGEFDNWFHQFSLMARVYQWDPREKNGTTDVMHQRTCFNGTS